MKLYAIYRMGSGPSLQIVNDRVYIHAEKAYAEKEILEREAGLTKLYVMDCDLIEDQPKTITLKQPIEVHYRYDNRLIYNLLPHDIPTPCELVDFLFAKKASFTKEDKQKLLEAGYESEHLRNQD